MLSCRSGLAHAVPAPAGTHERIRSATRRAPMFWYDFILIFLNQLLFFIFSLLGAQTGT